MRTINLSSQILNFLILSAYLHILGSQLLVFSGKLSTQLEDNILLVPYCLAIILFLGSWLTLFSRLLRRLCFGRSMLTDLTLVGCGSKIVS